MALNKKVEIEIAIAIAVIAAVISGAVAYYYGKASSKSFCLYPTERSIALLNLFGKVVVVPPNERVSGDWGTAKYEPKCNKAELYVKFKSGLELKIEGMPNGNLEVKAEYQGSKCSKEIKAVPALPYIVVTASVNRVLVSAYGKVLVINMIPSLSCSLAGTP